MLNDTTLRGLQFNKCNRYLKVECKVTQLLLSFTLFQIVNFSTLKENRNNFQFSQAVCAKSSCKLTCLKPREISIMLISLYKCPVVTSFVSFLNVIDFFFVRTKITSLCAKRLGGRTLVNLLLITLTLKSKSILITKFRL